MPKNTRRGYRFVTFTLLSIGLAATLLITAALAFTPIDFEGLNTNGVPGKIVTTDYANRGVKFAPVWAVDFSLIAPDFAHSGVMALDPCVGFWPENCTSPLEMFFCHPQQEVGLWVGYTGQLSTGMQVIMRSFDLNDLPLSSAEITLGPSTGPIPVRKFLRIQALPKIRRVTVGFKGAEVWPPTAYNNGLAFDDLQFTDESPCTIVCPSGQAPAFSINLPANNQVFSQNTLTVGGDLPAANPGATFQIDVTGPQGQTRRHGPHAISPGQIFLPNLGGLLFPGINSLIFTVKDCAGSYTVLRTVDFCSDILTKRFLVVDEKGFAVAGAEIYVDGNLKGRTDQNGKLTVESIPACRKVIARKMVYESPTDRDHHKSGSYRNWKGRWYISNLAVNNDGSVSADEVTLGANPSGYQLIRLHKRNTLVGLNLVVSLEWDASVLELENVKQQIFETSYRLYNATDGQVMIEQARIADEGTYWVSDTDIRVWADYSFSAKTKRNAFFETSSFWPWVDPYLRLSRADFYNPDEGAKLIVHELGHYLFGVRDEYEDGDGDSSYCTAKLKSGTPPYEPNSQYATCVMNSHWNTVKFCSHLAGNPHRTETEQGSSSCWKRIIETFGDSDKWVLQSPETRGVIVGQLNSGSLPVPAWSPNVSVENRGKPFLCEPKLFRFVKPDGTPIKDREIELSDFFGLWSINQGLTDANGEITVAGMHLGDRVDGNLINTCTLTAQNTVPSATDRFQIIPTAYSGPQAGSQSLTPQVITVEPRRFDVFTELKPLKREEAEISVFVKTLSGSPLAIDQRPVVKVWSRDPGEVLNVSTKYDASRAGFVGTLRRLPSDGRVHIRVAVTNGSAETETVSGWFQIAGNEPNDDAEVTSANGQLSLGIPQGTLPRGATVSIGPGTMTEPILPGGYEVVRGPYSVWWSTGECMPGFLRLKFELSRNPNRSEMSGYIRESFTILYYNPDVRRWEDIGGVVHPAPMDIVSQLTNRIGNYVLVARRDSAKQPGHGGAMNRSPITYE